MKVKTKIAKIPAAPTIENMRLKASDHAIDEGIGSCVLDLLLLTSRELLPLLALIAGPPSTEPPFLVPLNS